MKAVFLVFFMCINAIHATEMSMTLSKEEAIFGSTFVINISIFIENESVEKPTFEIHFPPKFRFSKASITSNTCQSPNSLCTSQSESFTLDAGILMGKFQLGDQEIKATRSFNMITPKESQWHHGYVHKSSLQLQDIHSLDPVENTQFAICVFRYWKNQAKIDSEAQRSIGKYFFLHPANVSLRVVEKYDFDIPVSRYRILPHESVKISMITRIDPRSGNVVMKLSVPSQLKIMDDGYGLGSVDASGALMRTTNRSANIVELYVLITPEMLQKSGDQIATLDVTVKADQAFVKPSNFNIYGSVLYGIDFRFHIDTNTITLTVLDSTAAGPILPERRRVIEYAPVNSQYLAQDQQRSEIVNISSQLVIGDTVASGLTSAKFSSLWVINNTASSEINSILAMHANSSGNASLNTSDHIPAHRSVIDESTMITSHATLAANISNSSMIDESALITNHTPVSTPHPNGTDFDGPCPPGWWHLDILHTDCYLSSNQQLSHTEAENACANLGSHLISIHSVHDFLILSTFWMNNLKYNEVWIGFNRNTSRDEWTWTDDRSVDYIDWCENNPSDGAKNCAIFSDAPADNYCWKNRICGESMYFFCTKPKKNSKPIQTAPEPSKNMKLF